jgi:glycerophosphoryl diester phosphodiesterase
MLPIAHRGAPRLATENTLPSIEAAIDNGARWVEIDVKLTRDKVPVLLHDRTLNRIWDVPKPVAELDLEDLPAGIPTLRCALEFVRGSGVRLLIDLPSPPEAEPSLAVVGKAEFSGSVAFTGDTDALAAVRVALPDAIIAMTWESPWLPREQVFERVRPQFFNQAHQLVTNRSVSVMHDRGLMVSTYTVDDPGRMRQLARRGVDAIISNDIGTLAGLTWDLALPRARGRRGGARAGSR